MLNNENVKHSSLSGKQSGRCFSSQQSVQSTNSFKSSPSVGIYETLRNRTLKGLYGKLKGSEQNIYENLLDVKSRRKSSSENVLNSKRDSKLSNYFSGIFDNILPKKATKPHKDFKIELVKDTCFHTQQTFDLQEIVKIRVKGETPRSPASDKYRNFEFDDENIYENLNFGADNDPIEISCINESVHDWMSYLVIETEDYEDDPSCFYVKSVPSKINCFNSCDNYYYQTKQLNTASSEYAQIGAKKYNNCMIEENIVFKTPSKHFDSEVENFKRNYQRNQGKLIKKPLQNQNFTCSTLPDQTILYDTPKSPTRQSSQDEITHDLLTSLLDIFDSLLHQQRSAKTVGVLHDVTDVNSVKTSELHIENHSLSREFEETTTPTELLSACLECGLNRVVITYDFCLKVYLALCSTPLFNSVVVKLLSANQCDKIARICWNLCGNSNKRLNKEFRAKLLNFCWRAQYLGIRSSTNESVENYNPMIEPNESATQPAITIQINDISIAAKPLEMGETLYQPIWNMTTEGSPDNNNNSQSENIYVSLDFVETGDDWEPAESEFAFTFSMDEMEKIFRESERKKMEQMIKFDDPYRTICILYNDKSPELNHIVYEYNRDKLLSYDSSDLPKCLVRSHKSYIVRQQSTGEVSDSVEAWKKSMLSFDYLDEEEDVIMTDKVIPLTYIPAEAPLSVVDPHDSSDGHSIKSNDSLSNIGQSPTKTKESLNLFQVKNGSFTVTSPGFDNIKDMTGSYKAINSENSSTECLNDTSPSLEPEKKEERKRFRDNFKIKSKPKNGSDENIKGKESEVNDFEKYLVFGCELSKVEKDVESPNVPKFVVECIKLLNRDENLKTAGIYRASGNKNSIEAVKKKINEKKYSKRDDKYAILESQDIHTLSCLLKLYFRDLMPGLIPAETFQLCTRGTVTVDETKQYINKMDKLHLDTLHYLMEHLKKVELNCSENLMNSSNLAIVWGACIFSGSFTSANTFYDISNCNILFKKLLDEFSVIFSK